MLHELFYIADNINLESVRAPSDENANTCCVATAVIETGDALINSTLPIS